MAKTIDVIPVGTKVMLLNEIGATVTAVNIRSGNRLQYEVSWASGSNHTCKWVEECELTTTTKQRTTIGFGGHRNG